LLNILPIAQQNLNRQRNRYSIYPEGIVMSGVEVGSGKGMEMRCWYSLVSAKGGRRGWGEV